MIALIVSAFLAGAALAFVLGTVRDLGRPFREYRRARQARQAQAIAGILQHGVDARLAGRAEEARRAFEDVLRRDPMHPDAPMLLAAMAQERGETSAALGHHLAALRAAERPATLLAVADDYRRLGRPDDAVETYRRVLARDQDHVAALRGLRDLEADRDRWPGALEVQERLLRIVGREDRAAEEQWRLGIQYEIGRVLAKSGDGPAAAARFHDVLRGHPDFLPAAVALGDLLLKAGDTREAMRVWERALQVQLASPLLSRVERIHRAEGRPARMVALYQDAAARQPENLAVAFGLGRVYFELAMLDEAAEQFQKLEVRAPALALVHAYLGGIFERRGQVRQALQEYRRALRFPEAFEWPHRCAACGAGQPSWIDRCPSCRRWNTSRP